MPTSGLSPVGPVATLCKNAELKPTGSCVGVCDWVDVSVIKFKNMLLRLTSELL